MSVPMNCNGGIYLKEDGSVDLYAYHSHMYTILHEKMNRAMRNIEKEPSRLKYCDIFVSFKDENICKCRRHKAGYTPEPGAEL
jgi:hypothetical protein